ncbi:hypothetical protein SAMN02746041_00691 [Desulfacinum hydrothermale DSM 13146]|uniref:Type IV pilus assembly protein PilX n=1 Tax=Desulfacinum hydrothermale DSM 13146 TaxID=1121390 RepID=A0A1W1X6K9_9BACT|nr:hypothetical protein [Desulfacinum hydrothermale]SMC19484.1 hypothetical protein SAMN02746041_00691 [Desulfacinum hydrothermale DSM 13146]
MTVRLADQSGIALVTTLMLMLLGMGLVALLLFSTTTGTKVSRMEGTYTTCLEAAKGGAEAIISMFLNDLQTPDSILNATVSSGSACLKDKMEKATTAWASCGSHATDLDPDLEPDITFNLASYDVRIKIVDTRETDVAYIYSVVVGASNPSTGDRAEVAFLYEMEK